MTKKFTHHLKNILSYLKSIFMNTNLPRSPSNPDQIDTSKVTILLILESDTGITKYIIAVDNKNKEQFYFEKITPQMGAHLHVYSNLTHETSKISDKIHAGDQLRASVDSLKTIFSKL
jgi:exosome complex RNA-binding protein Csl4